MKPLRLRAPRITESQVIDAVIGYLHLRAAQGHIAWFKRNNGGGAKSDKRWIWFYRLWMGDGKARSKGYVDIDGLLTDGRMFLIEVKGEGTKITNEQREIIERAKRYGAAAGFAGSVEDVVEILAANN